MERISDQVEANNVLSADYDQLPSFGTCGLWVVWGSDKLFIILCETLYNFKGKDFIDLNNLDSIFEICV